MTELLALLEAPVSIPLWIALAGATLYALLFLVCTRLAETGGQQLERCRWEMWCADIQTLAALGFKDEVLVAIATGKPALARREAAKPDAGAP